VSDPTEIVARGYDAIADAYLAWSQEEDFPARRKYLTYLLDALPDGADVLELGCGAGLPVTRALSERMRVTGVDISRGQLELARTNAPEATFIQANMDELELPERAFDAVVALHSVTHGWLRLGGIFVASFGGTDNPSEVDEDWLGAPMFFSHFDAETTVALVENAGFETLRRELIQQGEHGVEGAFLWLVARSI
jgi:SAM-dependent methyltransferase